MKTRHSLLSLCLLSVLIIGVLSPQRAVAGGLPTVDVIGNALLGKSYGELTALVSSASARLAQLGNLYKTAQDELKVVTDTYNTMNDWYKIVRGVTKHGLLLSNPLKVMHDYLPRGQLPDIDVLFNTGGGLTRISTLAQRSQMTREKFKSSTLFSGIHLPSEKKQYEDESKYIYGYMGVARSAYEKIEERKTKLASLAAAIRTADTPKAIQDLNTRINAENALLLNDIAQLQVLKMMADLERDNLIHNQNGAEKDLKSVNTIQ